MQLLDTPRTGKLGPHVFYTDTSGQRQFCRTRAIPADPRSPAQSKMRALMAHASGLWSLKLTDPQREQWIAAALNAPSHPWLGRYTHLSGQQLEIKINLTLACTGKPLVLTPPEPVAFAPNPVTALDAVQDPEAGVRLRLSVGTVSEDIMVFGQPPCSAGRMKPRRVYYLGLLGAVANGQADITDLYTAKFGAPAPGKKIFIVTCQTKDGWKAQDSVFKAVIPPPPPAGKQRSNQETEGKMPAASAQPESKTASAGPVSSLSLVVYKRSTPAARGMHRGNPGMQPVSIPGTPLVHGLRVALRKWAALWVFGARAEGGAIG